MVRLMCDSDEVMPVRETNTTIEEDVGDDCEEYDDSNVVSVRMPGDNSNTTEVRCYKYTYRMVIELAKSRGSFSRQISLIES